MSQRYPTDRADIAWIVVTPFLPAARPGVARDALLATQGGLSLELCAVIYHCVYLDLWQERTRDSTWCTRRSTNVGCGSTMSIAVASAVAAAKTAAAYRRWASAIR